LDQPYRDAGPTARRGRISRTASACYPTIRYWAQTEVHVHAFSISANILLSFFPFLIVMVSLCQNVFHWRAGSEAVYFAVGDYFPDQIGAFIERNLRATVASRGPIQIVSILLLLFTANGVFEPMEVALNRIWGCRENRSYLRNQIVSLGLIFACGALAMVSTMFTALNNQMLVNAFGSNGADVRRVGTCRVQSLRRFQYRFWRCFSFIGYCRIARCAPARSCRPLWASVFCSKSSSTSICSRGLGSA
jgi:uncharacterized BrkB/YihY/UPF0761 family membrane protein